MLQYKIPQNVEVEDKIVGPLTMKQLIICAVGGGTAYVMFLTLSGTYFIEVWLPPVALVSIITLMIAFLEIRGIKFTKWVFLMIEAMMNPNKRVWDKSESIVFIYAVPSARLKAEEEKQQQKEADDEEDRQRHAEPLPQLDELTKALHMPNDTKPQQVPTAAPTGAAVPTGDANVISNDAPVRPAIARKPTGS